MTTVKVCRLGNLYGASAFLDPSFGHFLGKLDLLPKSIEHRPAKGGNAGSGRRRSGSPAFGSRVPSGLPFAGWRPMKNASRHRLDSIHPRGCDARLGTNAAFQRNITASRNRIGWVYCHANENSKQFEQPISRDF